MKYKVQFNLFGKRFKMNVFADDKSEVYIKIAKWLDSQITDWEIEETKMNEGDTLKNLKDIFGMK